jgi:hypothetical protein
MTTRVCDRCGAIIEEGALRYVIKIEVFAASDTLKISFEDLAQDHAREFNALLLQCEGMTEEELMRDVHVDFRFDLCRACQKTYVANPLPPPDPGQG